MDGDLNKFKSSHFQHISFQYLSLFQIPRNTETAPQHGSSSPLSLEGKKTTHRQPSENNASKAYRGGDAFQTAEIHAPRQVSKDHLIILNRVETIDRRPLDLSSREGYNRRACVRVCAVIEGPEIEGW